MEKSEAKDDTFFTFRLGDGVFAMPIRYVREVLTSSPITPVPNSISYLRGVMNIRGTVITVIDFRILFDLPVDPDPEKTSIIVTEIPNENEPPMVVSILADGVDQVVPLDFIKADGVAYGVVENRKEFVKAVAERNKQFVLLLDIEKILESIEKEVADEPEV